MNIGYWLQISVYTTSRCGHHKMLTKNKCFSYKPSCLMDITIFDMFNFVCGLFLWFPFKVAAFSDGRNAVSQYDCLLLQHIFWNQPEEAERIYDWLLGRIAFSDDLEQVQYLIAGIFGRSCKYIKKEEKIKELLVQIKQIKQVLLEKLASVQQCLNGELLLSLWSPFVLIFTCTQSHCLKNFFRSSTGATNCSLYLKSSDNL